MDIKNRKFKGHAFLSILIILCIIASSATLFLMHNKMGAKETQLIEPLADAQPVINSPVLEVGSERYISPSAQFDNSSAVKYSQMTGALGVTAVGNNGISITTESSSNPKYEFFDFNTKIVVPARTEYTVKYKITYTLYKNATNNTSNIYSSLYDYGKDYHKDSPESYKINAQKLYETNGDFDIGPSGDYFINRIQTNACKSTVSDSYEYTATHTNKSKAEMEFFHNYSCYVFGWKGTGTTKSYSMKATVSVTAEIEAKLLGQASPVDVEVEYTGQSLSLANVEESQKTWYNASLMSIDYSANADMVNAGLKKVKVTITASDEFFKEAPDESIGESDTVRYFNFTITKKKIGVDITEKTGGGGLEVNAKTGAVYTGDTEVNKRAPIFAVSYKNNSTGIVYDSFPTDVGTYTATVSISNDCNYELDGSYTETITVDARKVAKPSVGLTTLPYNGETQDFTVSGMSNDVTITAVTSGLTYSNGKLSAKDFGTYKATVSLADGGKNTEWVGGGTADYEITLNIEKAKLSITFSSDGGWSWNSGVSKTVSITDNRKKDSEVLSFSVSYDGNAISNVTASSTPKQTDIVIPPLSSQSSAYKLSVSLNDSGDGKNYDLIGITTQDFNITDKVIKVEESNIIWSYTNGNETKQLASWDSTSIFEVTYNGKEFEFSAKLSGLDPKDEVIIDGYTTETGEDAGEYTTIVTLKSSVGQLTQSSFTLKWKINKALFDLSNVKWDYDPAKPYEYNDNFHEVKLTGLPKGLSAEYEDNRKMNVGKYTAQVSNLIIAENLKNNYVRPEIGNALTYQCKDENGDDKVVPWKCDWEIKKAVLDLSWVKKTYDDKNSRKIRAYEVSDEFMRGKIEYKYYAESDYVDGVAVGAAVDFSSLTVTPGVELKYYVVAVIKSQYKDEYEIKAGTQYKRFTVGSQAPIRDIKIESKFSYDGKAHGVKEEWQVSNNSHIVAQYYSVGNDGIETLIEGAPINAGKYVIKLDIEDGYEDTFELSGYKFAYEITKAQILAVWNTEGEIPVIENATQVIEYEYSDEEGNIIADVAQLEKGKNYTAVAKIKSEYAGNYEFVDADGIVLAKPTVTEGQEFEIKTEDPTTPINPNDPNNPGNSGDDNKDPDDGSDPVDIGEVGEFLQKYWQPIVTAISILLLLIFISKGIGCANKRKRIKKTIERKYSSYYAAAGTGLFGLTYTNWTIVACIMMGVALLSFIFMMLEKNMLNKAEEELEEAKEEYARDEAKRQSEDMKMMLMGVMGGNANGGAQGGYAYAQQPMLGAEEMRGMISEVVTALLPGVQQMLPQQASTNNELVEKLLEKTTKNEEAMQKLIKKVAEQPAEKIVEREVAATSVSEEVLDRLASKLQPAQSNINEDVLEKLVNKLQPATNDETILKVVSHSEQNDETIKQLLKNQEILMEKILELSANQQSSEPQVVEKIVEKEVKVEVPIEVEKVVEKIVEIPVEKVVEIPAQKPAPKAKTVTPRLTLDEAYEKLSAKQKKFFDTLKAYAMSKDKCKEKKSTYYILLGQSSVNPLVKLTIKKETTVALFKMEDEFMKDIRRNASNDGTKVKVKETELIVGDAQALATAKEMVDLREDQIERYNEYLKEQRSMKK